MGVVGGGVSVGGLSSASNGELDGEDKGEVMILGNVKARGVGDMILNIGVWTWSTVTSSAAGGLRDGECDQIALSSLWHHDRVLTSRVCIASAVGGHDG